MATTTFHVGDLVTRKGSIPGDIKYRGTINRVYTSAPNGRGESMTMYEITWAPKPDPGYLGHGLELITPAAVDGK